MATRQQKEKRKKKLRRKKKRQFAFLTPKNTTSVILIHSRGKRDVRQEKKKKKSGDVSLVCWCLVLGALQSCGAVQLWFPRRVSIYLLHAYKQGGRHLLRQSHHSPFNSTHPTLLSISSFVEQQLATSEATPGFEVVTSIGWEPFGRRFRPFCSFFGGVGGESPLSRGLALRLP